MSNEEFNIYVSIRENSDINRMKTILSSLPRQDRRLVVLTVQTNRSKNSEIVFNTKKRHIAERIAKNVRMAIRENHFSGKIEVSQNTINGWKTVTFKQNTDISNFVQGFSGQGLIH